MPKIIFLDTYYPSVFKRQELEFIPYECPEYPSYNSRTRRQMQLDKVHFGTAYYYSKTFKQLGWDAEDVVGNDAHMYSWEGAAFQYIYQADPDIVYCQDLSFLTPAQIMMLKTKGVKVVAQHSCPWAGDAVVSMYDMVFTSFPHYLEKIRLAGTVGHFLPIAFGHWVLDYVSPQERDIDILFVGGVNGGSSGHWASGTRLLERVAETFPNFQWYGYSIGNLPRDSALARSYRGESWGIDMYKLLARAKIVFNRHGEVAQGYSNNMRMFEATGMGACLFTEYSKNIYSYFDINEAFAYSTSPMNVLHYLGSALQGGWWKGIAEAGQARTLKDHTYEKRLTAIEPILKDLIK